MILGAMKMEHALMVAAADGRVAAVLSLPEGGERKRSPWWR